jgi:tRNA A-37 threonylcarbamoyl transferase component Bud32
MVNCPRDEILLTEPDPLIGEVLDARYEVVEFIGQGGMSLVYKAKHNQLERYVAIKLLKPEYLTDVANIQRFRREAKAASFLQHAHINGIYAVGVTNQGQPYLVLEFLEGKSFAHLLAEEKPLAMPRLLRLFEQMLDGLSHAHERGVIHRDLKPSNVVIAKDSDGRELVKIVDFGTAKVSLQDEAVQQQLTQAGEVLGTLLYMSPEQKKGQKVDARSDIYSLGYMLFEAAESEGVAPPELQAIIEKALCENADQRYQTAAEMRRAMVSLARPEDASAIGAGEAKHGLSRLQVKVLSWGASVVVLLAVATGVGLAMSSDVNKAHLKYAWLKLSGAPAEQLALAADARATAIIDSGANYAEAARIYEQDMAPLLSNLSGKTAATYYFGLGRAYCKMKDTTRARVMEDSLSALIKRSKRGTAERQIAFIQRLRLRAEEALVPPFTSEKIRDLDAVAKSFLSEDCPNDARDVYLRMVEAITVNPSSDEMVIEVLNSVATNLVDTHPETAYAMNERLYSLLEARGKLKDPAYALVVLRHGEKLEFEDQDLRAAEEVYRTVADSTAPKSEANGMANARMGLICKFKARFGAAVRYLELAVEAHRAKPLKKRMAVAVYTEIGRALVREGEADAAFAYYDEIYKQFGEEALVMEGVSIGLAEGYVAGLFSHNRPEEALSIGSRALDRAVYLRTAKQLAMCDLALRLAEEHRKRNHPKRSVHFAQAALGLAQDPRDVCKAKYHLADYAVMDGDLKAAKKYCAEIDTLVKSSGQNADFAFLNEALLASIYDKEGDLKSAKQVVDHIADRLGDDLYEPSRAQALNIVLLINEEYGDKPAVVAHATKALQNRRRLGLADGETQYVEQKLRKAHL